MPIVLKIYLDNKMLAKIVLMDNNDFMTETIVNSGLLKTLIERAGGSVTVAYESGVGHSTLEKMMAGTYQSLPRKKLREKLCTFLKVKEVSLFPFVQADGAVKAS